MSSFLCFVCHSTVNADTNEETRDKYREVIGMHLCPDSHLCYICCYFLNKMCMFKSICLKRSLEYPVLFSEKGTINLQRGDIQVAILCPEDICLQHLNTRYHFYNNNDNSQSDYGDNSYCQLQDENINNTFHCQMQDESLKSNDFHCQMQDESLKTNDYHCQMQDESLKTNDYNCQMQDSLKTDDYHCQTQEKSFKTNDFHCQMQEKSFKTNEFNFQMKDASLKSNFYCQMQEKTLKMNDFNFQMQDASLKTNFSCEMQDGSFKIRFNCQNQNYNIQNTIFSYNEDKKLKNTDCQINDDNANSSNCKLEDNSNTNFHCQIQDRNFANIDHCKIENDNITHTNNQIQEEHLKTNLICQHSEISNTDKNYSFQQGNLQNTEIHSKHNTLNSTHINYQMQENDFKYTPTCKMQDDFKRNVQNQDGSLKNSDIFKETSTNENNKKDLLEIHAKDTTHNYVFEKDESNEIFTKDVNYENEPQSIDKQKETIVLEMNKMEIEIPINDLANQESDDQENSLYDSTISDTDTQLTQIKVKKKKEFARIKLSVKEQKKELEDARKEEKYVTASYKCFNCAISFHFKDSYQAHMMRHEESNGEYSCPICSLRFANPAVLRSHSRNHTERFKCTQCKTIVRARQRMTHKRMCSGSQDDDNSVSCHLCHAEFIGLSHLQQHMKRYHQAKNSNRTYLCNICGKSYNNQAAVRTHMITHINRKFPCDQCTSTFSSPYTLNQHKKKHNIKDLELHYCTECKVGYNTRKSLLAHLRNALAHKNSIYKCPLCPRVCPTLKALQSHTDAIHARTNHLSCDICPAKYSTRKALIRHLRSHKGESRKPTTLCHACGENFKSSSILKRHLKNVCEKDKIEELFYEQ